MHRPRSYPTTAEGDIVRRWLVFVTLLCLTPAVHADYWPQNDPRSGGMRDLMLLYLGDSFCTRNHYTAADLLPYVAYLDRQHEGRPVDWFYDCYLFLTIFGAPSGQKYDDGATNLADWRFYLDLLFDRDLNMHALDDAISRAAETLGPPPRKIPVMLMMPYMSPKQQNFGVIDDSGQSLDFSKPQDLIRCVNWFLDDTSRRFNEGQFKNLSLWGYYRMNEGMGKAEEESAKAVARVIHERKFGLHWIPWSGAESIDHWRDLGFDFAVLQPNYACNEDLYRPRDEQQLTDTADRARKYGLGIEIEVPYRTIYGSGDREGLYDYLNHGLPAYEGYMSAVHGYYQTIVDIGRMYASDVPADNRLYRDLYMFHKQTYREHPACVSQGVPCVVRLPGLAPEATLALTGETPAAPAEAVTIPGSGGVLTLSFPTVRRPRKVLLHARFEGAGPEASAFAVASMYDEGDQEARLIGAAASPPTLSADPGWHWWRIIGTPQVGRSLAVQFSGPQGGRLIIDQVRLLPVAGPGLDATCMTDGVGDGQSLTDREYAAGTRDEQGLVKWPGGRGKLTLQLPDDRHVGTLWLHAIKLAQGQWPSHVEVNCGGKTAAVDLPAPNEEWAGYLPVKLPLALSGQCEVSLEGSVEGQPIALDEVEQELATNLARGKPYTFEPPNPPAAQSWNYPDDGKKLTDGEFAEQFLDHKLAGWLNASPSLIVDLGQPEAVTKVRVHTWGGGVADTYFPTSTTVWVSPDGSQWRPMLRRIAPPAEPPGATMVAKAWLEAPVSAPPARYVRLDFVPHAFLLIDEIEVISNGVNVARGKTYRVVGPATRPPNGQYPDDGVRLTDGSVSLGFWNRLEVVGSMVADPTVTVDLGRPEALVLASAHVCGGGSAGVYYPTEVGVQTSLDGATWAAPVTTTEHPSEPAKLLDIPFPSPESRERTVGLMEVPLDAIARYVRWHLKRHGYCMVDEVEVYGP